MGEERVCSNCGKRVKDHTNEQLLECIKKMQEDTPK